jgi:hypothetical protein
MAVLGLVALGLLSYYSLLVVTDNIGTFRSTTDVTDLDTDGDLDVIVHHVRQEAEFTAFPVTALWFNQGDGRFVAHRLEGYPGEAAWSSAAGDVDRDGDADLFTFPGWCLRLILNLGGAQGGQIGEFGVNNTARPQREIAQFGSVIPGDLNNDGWVDCVVVGCCGRAFTVDPEDDTPNISWVWINEWDAIGRVASRGASIPALDGLALRAAALGDLDSDDDLDLFAAVIAPEQGQNTDPADRVLINDGSGNFTDSGQRLGETDSTAVALGDVDGDGDLDALVGTEEGALVWINQDGIFALSEQEISGDHTRSVFLSDVDGDGDPDALVAGRRRAVIWWNDGQAGFTRSNQRFRYSKRHGVVIGDFNGDGWPDIFAGRYSEDFRVWFNNGDGTFRFGSLWS